MVDIKFICKNAKKIKEAAKNKNIDIDINELIKIYKRRKSLKVKIEELKAQKNKLAGEIIKKPTKNQVIKGRKIKENIARFETEFRNIDKEYFKIIVKAPTIPSPDTPIGNSDKDNVEIYRFGKQKDFDFEPKSYIELADDLDLIDFTRGAKVAGYRGYYIKNEAVMMQIGMLAHALEKLTRKHNFTPMIPPTLVRKFALFGSGYFSGIEYNPEVDEIYKVSSSEKESDGKTKKEDKFLVGTAEPSLLAYYSNEILREEDMPIKICGFSQCYRSEIGSYGKDTKGIYRVHEFMKVEQVCICKADIKESDKIHKKMLEISKELHEDLELPYRVVQICTGDMSAGKYKAFDIEAWIPSRGGYGETGSASNFLDWQSRRLNVKYKDKNGNKKYAYMLNNTALASARPLIAILENHQQKDGSIVIPKVLRKWVGKDKIESVK